MADEDRAAQPRRSWRSLVPAPLRHGVIVFVILLVVEYLVIPRLVLAGHNLYLLKRLNIWWLVAGLLLEAAALFTYALLTRVLLPKDGPNLSTLFRIDLAGTAIAHVLPGGSAGSATLGYRLLTSSGVSGADAGFAMATQGMGSAVVLNILLWCALVVSIPLAGFKPVYVAAALIGMLGILAVAFLVFLFTRGEESAARFVRGVARRIPRMSEERFEGLVRHIGQGLRALATDRELLRRALLWATLNWLLDAASLWAFIFAFGRFVSPVELLVAYGVGNVLAAIPITPSGLGLVETSVPLVLAGFGVPKGVSTLGVLGWRLVNFWLPIPVGAGAYISLKVQRGAGLRAQRRALSDMAHEAAPDNAPSGGGTGGGVSGDRAKRSLRSGRPDRSERS